MRAGSVEKRLVLLVAEYGYFLSHRLALAEAAAADGYQVTVITRVSDDEQAIRLPGITIVSFALRRNLSPLQDLAAVARLASLLRTIRPALIHNVSIKLAILGTLAGRLAGVPCIVNAYTGLGYVFRTSGVRTLLVRLIAVPILWLIARHAGTWSVFQNEDDLDRFRRHGLAHPKRLALIAGSGVELRAYAAAPQAPGDTLVLFVGRLLWDKGIGEFVQAAQLLRGKGLKARFAAVGDPDPENPTSVDRETLAAWQQAGAVEWWGFRRDMATLYREAGIVCLPSYHEGLPKVILEAGAAARPVVTSRIPGCAAVIEDGVNGLLVPVRDAQALADALERLVNDRELRETMGRAGRRRIEGEFSVQIVNRRFLDLYRELSRPAGRSEQAPR